MYLSCLVLVGGTGTWERSREVRRESGWVCGCDVAPRRVNLVPLYSKENLDSTVERSMKEGRKGRVLVCFTVRGVGAELIEHAILAPQSTPTYLFRDEIRE
jgi:hypothetical protein